MMETTLENISKFIFDHYNFVKKFSNLIFFITPVEIQIARINVYVLNAFINSVTSSECQVLVSKYDDAALAC